MKWQKQKTSIQQSRQRSARTHATALKLSATSVRKIFGIRTIARMDTIPKDTIPKDTIPNGHNPEWTQSRMDTILNGHNPE